jgi:hypothetical protein
MDRRENGPTLFFLIACYFTGLFNCMWSRNTHSLVLFLILNFRFSRQIGMLCGEEELSLLAACRSGANVGTIVCRFVVYWSR